MPLSPDSSASNTYSADGRVYNTAGSDALERAMRAYSLQNRTSEYPNSAGGTCTVVDAALHVLVNHIALPE